MAERRKLTRATKKEYVHRTQRKHTFGKHFYPKYFLWPHILCAWSISDGWTSYFWLGALKLKRKFARKSIKKARAQSALQHTQHTHAMCVCLLANPVTRGPPAQINDHFWTNCLQSSISFGRYCDNCGNGLTSTSISALTLALTGEWCFFKHPRNPRMCGMLQPQQHYLYIVIF